MKTRNKKLVYVKDKIFDILNVTDELGRAQTGNLLKEKEMNKPTTYITYEETINCQKVADAFSEVFENKDLIIFNAGKYGFVKLQYFKFPFGFDTIDSYYNGKSLFDDLWDEWLHTQLINFTADTPMADMEYDDILKCLSKEKRKELLDKKFYFAERTGIKNLLVEL